MPTFEIQPSFANGEFAPQLYARVDLAKYKTAAALMRNMFVDYRGGASNRAGTKIVGPCKEAFGVSPPRLIPFQFSTVQAYMLEFGTEYIRVIKNGAYVLESLLVITGITQANPAVVTSAAHGYSNGDYVYIANVAGMTQVNGRTFIIAGVTANTFQLVDPLSGLVNSTAYSAYSSGGTVGRVYTIVSPYSAADLPALKYTQSADVMTLTHPSYAARDLVRLADNSWTLSIIVTAAALTPPGGVTVTPSTVGTVGYTYQVSAVTAGGDESSASGRVGTLGVDISQTTGGHIIIRWNPVSNAEFYNVYKAGAVKAAGANFAAVKPVSTLLGFMETTQALSVVDYNIAPDFAQTPPIAQNPIYFGRVTTVTVTNGGAGYTSAPTVAFVGASAGVATAEAILDPAGGGTVSSVIITNSGFGYLAAPAVTFAGGAGAGAAATATISPTTGEFPSVAAYFQQRRFFANSVNQPQTFWASQTGLPNNFNISNPSRDDDSISGTLASNQVNAIKHLIPMPGGLIALTSYGAWQINGNQGSAMTPANSQAQAQGYKGASEHPPIIVNNDILYIQSKGAVVLDFAYNLYSNIYMATDISTLSSHLFNGYTIKEWAYADMPLKVVWATRSDGKLLSCTFLKEQEVIGWAQHDTFGQFMSVAVIPEGTEDAVYFIIHRYINGINIYYTERMASRELRNHIENGWFLDCAVQNELPKPNAILTPATRSGTNVLFTASAAVFFLADVGKIIRVGGGKATIVSYVSATQVRCDITETITAIFPDNVNNLPLPQLPGTWSMDYNIVSAGGLWHLEGMLVSVVGDGIFQNTRVVVNGVVGVDPPASLVLAGLPYFPQLQTLRLDVGGLEPTVQARRKQAFGVSVRIANSYGFTVGPQFTTEAMQLWQDPLIGLDFSGTIGPVVTGTNVALYTGDYRRTMGMGWNKECQLCITLNDPYPLTVLGIIPEFLMGDTEKKT